MTKQAKITALILTYNGGLLLDKCLQSLSFCDNIVIIDSFSKDNTKEIAKKHNAIIIENPFAGFAEQSQFGINWIQENIACDWIFNLDQDEICSPKLKQSLLEVAQSSSHISAYKIARLTWYYNRFLKHGGNYPDMLYRFFKPQSIHVVDHNGHSSLEPRGDVSVLEGDIIHYTYSSFYNQLDKLNLYANNGAKALEKKGKKGGILSASVHALWRFIYMYILKRGFLDGRAGFLMAIHTAFYTFSKYIRVQEGDWGYPYHHGLEDFFISNSQETHSKKDRR